MAALPYMPFYPADYLADTRHLSTLEHGAYLLLILSYWNSGKPLPDNDARLSRLAGLSADEWAGVKPLVAEFFDIGDGEWRHGRIDRDLGAISEKVAKAKAAAEASVRARANARSNGRSTDAQTNVQTGVEADAQTDVVTNQNQNQNQISPNGEGYREFVQRVFDAWNEMASASGLSVAVKLTDKRRKAIAARIADFDADLIIKAIQRIPESRFLMGDNDRGWRADLDFAMRPGSMTKLIEGAYHNRGHGKGSGWLDD